MTVCKIQMCVDVLLSMMHACTEKTSMDIEDLLRGLFSDLKIKGMSI